MRIVHGQLQEAGGPVALKVTVVSAHSVVMHADLNETSSVLASNYDR